MVVDFSAGTYLVGEPVLIRCALINNTSRPITIPYGGFGGNVNRLVFEIRDSQGQTVESLWPFIGDFASASPVTINSEHQFVRSFNLVDHHAIGQAGSYEIRARFASNGTYHAYPVTGAEEKRTTGWKGTLEQYVGKVKIVEPTERQDRDALKDLVTAADERWGEHTEYRYVGLFYNERKCLDLIEAHPDSRYATYARYHLGITYLNKFERSTARQYAESALLQLEAIDASNLQKLLGEYVSFHLIEARLATSTDSGETERAIKAFKSKYPRSPFVPVLVRNQ